MINLRRCPNCGIDAIRIEADMKPNEIAECNNCHAEYKLKDIIKKRRPKK